MFIDQNLQNFNQKLGFEVFQDSVFAFSNQNGRYFKNISYNHFLVLRPRKNIGAYSDTNSKNLHITLIKK